MATDKTKNLASDKVVDYRNNGGKLATYAWPGGYPLYYLAADNGVICPACANGENGSLCQTPLDPGCPDDNQWRLVAADVHWEGVPLTCDHCSGEIESAYGNPADD